MPRHLLRPKLRRGLSSRREVVSQPKVLEPLQKNLKTSPFTGL